MSTDTTREPLPATPTPTAPPGAAAPDPARFVWRLAGAVLSIGLIATGVASAAGWLAYQSETQRQTYRGDIARIVVDAGAGDVTFVPGAEGEVAVQRRLRWSWTRPSVEETVSGNTLRIRYDCPKVRFGGPCDVDYQLRVPAGATVEVSNGSGDVTVRDLVGALTLRTGSGDVSVSGTRGALELRTGSGDVTAADVGPGQVSASTGSGDVSLAFSDRPTSVKADTGSGDVTVLVPPGGSYRIRVDADSGSDDVQVTSDPNAAASIEATAGAGDVTVGYR